MTEITAALVNTLRQTTGAPLMKCKAALRETGGDLARAETVLRGLGVQTTAAQAEGNQGFIAVYVHQGSQIVGLVELACTTDFVARSDEFRRTANELAMQVAATNPVAISADTLPPSVWQNESDIARAQVKSDPKLAATSEALRAEIAAKKAAKRVEDQCLLSQPYIRDPKIPVVSLMDDLKLKVREGIYVRRIARWRVGEPLRNQALSDR